MYGAWTILTEVSAIGKTHLSPLSLSFLFLEAWSLVFQSKKAKEFFGVWDISDFAAHAYEWDGTTRHAGHVYKWSFL